MRNINPKIKEKWAEKQIDALKDKVNEEFRPWPSNENIMVSKSGTFYYKVPPSSRSLGIKKGTPCYDTKGYPLMMEVCITVNVNNEKKPKVVNVGRMVLEAWGIPQTTDEKGILRDQVDHLSRDPFDNRLDNLRWATRSENMYNRNMKQLQASRNRCAKERGYKNWVDFLAKKRKAAMEEAGCETWGEFVASKHEGKKYRKD